MSYNLTEMAFFKKFLTKIRLYKQGSFLQVALLYLFLAISLIFISQISQPSELFEEVSDQELEVLKKFIGVLFEESEGGFVFFDQKPVCIHGYMFNDSFWVNSAQHKDLVALREGAAVWKKLQKNNHNLKIHVCQTKDPEIPAYAHILMINVHLFHKVVNENLSLFQYILGPTVTSQSLLNSLINDDQPFHALLKYNNILIGILLGFGTENSLYGSRMESILESEEENHPPFSSNLKKEFDQEFLPFSPSWNFKTLDDENDYYKSRLAISSPKLLNEKPNFVFGWLKQNSDNMKLISNLTAAQTKIQKLIKQKDFEIGVLEQFLGKKIKKTSAIGSKQPDKDLNEIVSRGIWESLIHYNKKDLGSFIEGFNDTHTNNLNVERSAYFPNYLTDFYKAQENFKNANNYFHELSQNKDVTSLVPLKLYYRSLVNNENASKTEGSLVTLSYSIFSPLGHCFAYSFDEIVNLNNTIPGFAYGVYGMPIGETREIYIHPSLAYGYKLLKGEECFYLKAIVTLKKVHNNYPLKEFKPITLDNLDDPKLVNFKETNYRNALKIKGALIADHLQKNTPLDLAKIANYLKKFYANPHGFSNTTQDEQDLINRMHWEIYYN